MNTMTGTRALIRLILRRDRIVLPVWVVVLAVIPFGYASSFNSLYPTAAARQLFAAGIAGNAAELSLLGPIFGSSVGALTAWRGGFISVLVALASLLTVIRHTRTEEEAGRRELLGATVVGRNAALSAALIVTLGANVIFAALVAWGLIGVGLPVTGAVALGPSIASGGWIFAAVAGVTAQLTEGGGAARGIAVAVLGLSYLVRAAGDAGGEQGSLSWLSWLSPIGWTQRIRPFADERWWVLALAIGVGVALCGVAFVLSARRDLGAGVLPPRLGPETASRGLSHPIGLAWRLHRGTLFAWVAGFAVVGAVIGGAAKSAAGQLDASPQLRDLFARLGGQTGLSNAYLAALMSILGVVASAYAIQATLRLRSEEESQHAESILATAIARLQWAISHVVFAMLGPAVVLAAAGLTSGLTYGLTVGDVGGALPRVLIGAIIQLPAVWVLAGISVALFGLFPRFTPLSWAALMVFFLLGQLGPLLRLRQTVLDLSPFTHIPKLPGGVVSVPPLVWLIGVTAVLIVTGFAGFRRRDIG